MAKNIFMDRKILIVLGIIINWFHDYAGKYYHLVGRMDIISARETRYIWGIEAGIGKDGSPFAILIYERRGSLD